MSGVDKEDRLRAEGLKEGIGCCMPMETKKTIDGIVRTKGT